MSTENLIRVCTKCKREFPATLEFFYKQKAGKFGLASWCKECHREVNRNNTREWYQDNKQHVSDYGKQYRVDYQEEIAAYNKDYYWSNVDRERERIRNNKKRFCSRILQYKREYYHQHRDVILESKSKKRAHKMQHDPVFHAKTKAQSKAGKAKRRVRELNAPGTHTAADILLQIASQTDKKGHLRCWWCGCIIDGTYHVDHRVALAKGGSNWPDNLVIACPVCNLSKNDKSPQEWAGRLL